MITTLPAWFTERQQAARARYESLPAPKRNDETWRFSNLKQLDFAGFEMAASNASAKDLIARSHGLGKTAAKFIFANDQLIHSECHVAAGIVCLPLADALVSHSDLVKAHFMKQETRLGSAKFAALHEA
jgi:Fe-S cluster assembly protein SufD